MKKIVVGQPIPDSSAHLYIERLSEQAAFESLKRGEWVSFVAPPRTGKSSALIRWKENAIGKGIQIATAECEKVSASSDLSQAATNLINRLKGSLSRPKGPRLGEAGSSESDLVTAVSEALEDFVTEALRGGSGQDRLWIILDEFNVFTKPPDASLTTMTVKLGQILVSAFAKLYSDASFRERCSVCFAGYFEPEDCVGLADAQLAKFTKLAVLRDFSKEDVIPYAADLRMGGADSNSAIASIFEHVGGMPLLFMECARTSQALQTPSQPGPPFRTPQSATASASIPPISAESESTEQSEATKYGNLIRGAADGLMASDTGGSATMFQLYWQCLVQFQTKSGGNALRLDTSNRRHALALRNLGLIDLDPGPVDKDEVTWTATIRSPWVAEHFGETWVKRLLTVPGRLWLASCAEWFARGQNDQYLPHPNVQEAWLDDGLNSLPPEKLTLAEQALKAKVLKRRSQSRSWQIARRAGGIVLLCVLAVMVYVYQRNAAQQKEQADQLRHKLDGTQGLQRTQADLRRRVSDIDRSVPNWSCIGTNDQQMLTQLFRDLEEGLPQLSTNEHVLILERDRALEDASIQAAHTLDAHSQYATALGTVARLDASLGATSALLDATNQRFRATATSLAAESQNSRALEVTLDVTQHQLSNVTQQREDVERQRLGWNYRANNLAEAGTEILDWLRQAESYSKQADEDCEDAAARLRRSWSDASVVQAALEDVSCAPQNTGCTIQIDQTMLTAIQGCMPPPSGSSNPAPTAQTGSPSPPYVICNQSGATIQWSPTGHSPQNLDLLRAAIRDYRNALEPPQPSPRASNYLPQFNTADASFQRALSSNPPQTNSQ